MSLDIHAAAVSQHHARLADEAESWRRRRAARKAARRSVSCATAPSASAIYCRRAAGRSGALGGAA